MKTTIINIPNEFVISSGEMVASDPCYAPSIHEPAHKLKTMNGRWLAQRVMTDTHGMGNRVAELHVFHESLAGGIHNPGERVTGWLGVDAGVAGFYDRIAFESELKEHYEEICELTFGKEQAGCFNSGVISSSGFGDGGYELFVQRNALGEVVAAKIVFIPEDDFEEEEEDEYEEDGDGEFEDSGEKPR